MRKVTALLLLVACTGCVGWTEDGGLTVDSGRVQEGGLRLLDAATGQQTGTVSWSYGKGQRFAGTFTVTSDEPPAAVSLKTEADGWKPTSHGTEGR